jgi:hypothetical protein
MKAVEQNDEDVGAEIAYPAYDLSEALKVAEGVRDLGGGNAPVARKLLARHLDYAETGPSYFQRIAAAKCFGIITGRGAYSLTELGRRYFYPTTENGRQIAAIKMLTSPKSFGIVAKNLDGIKLPAIEMLGNIIHSKAFVPVSKKNTLAGCFIRSAQAIGILDTSGILHCQSLLDSFGSPKAPIPPMEAKQEPPKYPADKVPKEFSDEEEHSLYLDKERTRKFSINGPLFLSRAEYERICKWIEVTLIVEENEKPS